MHQLNFKYQDIVKQMPCGATWFLFGNKVQEALVYENSDDDYFNVNTFLNIKLYLLFPLKLLYYYIKQFFIRSDKYSKDLPIILGVGRGYDYKNILSVVGINSNEANLINAFDFSDFMKYKKISLFSLFKSFSYLVKCIHIIKLSNLPRHIKNIVLDEACRNILPYSYLHSFFSKVKHDKYSQNIYTGGAWVAISIAAYSKLKCSFMHHGLTGLTYPGLIRNIHSIYVYDNDEKKYFEKIGVRSNIKLFSYDVVKNKSKSIIIFSREEGEGLDYDILTEIVNLFRSFNYSIMIKAHPRVPITNKLKSWSKRNKVIVIDNTPNLDGALIIKEVRPSFVIGIMSTVLCEALNMEIIPINAWGNKSKLLMPGMNDGPYDFDKRCLSWETESVVINDIIFGRENYRDTLYMLKNR